MIKYIVRIIIIMCCSLVSCNGIREQQETFVSLIGQEIHVPSNLDVRIQQAVLDYIPRGRDYTMIAYIDSSGCTSCRMKLPIWNSVINELKSYENVDVDFIMILNTTEKREIDYMLKRDSFLYPVVLDPDGSFRDENLLPKDNSLHTFLLDCENKIVAVGNPAFNPKIRDVYRKIISSGAKSMDARPGLYCEASVPIGVVCAEDTIEQIVSLQNKGDRIMTIREIIPSSNSLNVVWKDDTIAPYYDLTMILQITSDSRQGSFVSYADIFYNECDIPDRIAINGYTK